LTHVTDDFYDKIQVGGWTFETLQAESMAQVVEHLPSKSEALNLNLST
jgi:hypothetical protein